MHRSIACGLLLSALAVLAGGCGSTSTPTTPTPAVTTETFSGTLNPSAAVVHSFSASAAGQVIGTLTTVGPDATQFVGFSMGTFSATGVCQIVLDDTAALQGAILTGTASTSGNYCVRIYDIGSASTLGTPFTYTITVSHP